jgi:hypothetical protein
LTRHDRFLLNRCIAQVEPEFRRPFVDVWTVARKAIVVEYRSYIAVVLNRATFAYGERGTSYRERTECGVKEVTTHGLIQVLRERIETGRGAIR